MKGRSYFISSKILLFLAFSIPLKAPPPTILDVTLSSDNVMMFPAGQPGELRYAMNMMLNAQATGTSTGSWQVNFVNTVTTITLSAPLPMINLFNADTVTFVPAVPLTINGNGQQYRAFFVRQGAVTFQDMTIQNCKAQGGAGGSASGTNLTASAGGGGLGAGAALFVDQGVVTLSNVQCNSNAAIGGNGGNASIGTAPGPSGGGGGLGGNGGNGIGATNFGGAGGGGYVGNGGDFPGGFENGGGGGGGVAPGAGGGANGGGGGGGGCILGATGGGENTNGLSPGSFDFGGGGGGGQPANSGGNGGGVSFGIGGGSTANTGGGGGAGGFAGTNGVPGVAGAAGGTGGSGGGAGGGGGSNNTTGGMGGNAVLGGGGGGGGGTTASASIGGFGGNGGYGGGGGGNGGCTIETLAGSAGIGGFGGGGGGDAGGSQGGSGGFGGGGGGGASGSGGSGGFGGGGGAGAGGSGSGGSGGGNGGGNTISTGGGAGAGLGGAIFVNNGGTIILQNSCSTNGLNTATAGTGGSVAGGGGTGIGGIFLVSGAGFTIAPGMSNTVTIEDVIADDNVHSLPGGGNTVAGTGSGASLTMQGPGTLSLTAINTYVGVTTISGGSLSLNGPGSIGASSEVDLTASGAIFDISGTTAGTTIQDLVGISGSTVSLGSKTLTLGTSNSTEFDGAITGSGGITKQGTGTFTLSGNNTYSGQTLVTAASTVVLTGSGSIASSSQLNLSISGAKFDISGTTGATIKDLAGVTGTTITLGSATLTAGTSNSTTFNGVIQGAGGFTKQGSGILLLGGSTTYSGATSITAGSMRAGTNNAFSPNSSYTISSGATLDVNNTTETIGGLNGAGSVALGTGLLTVNNTSASDTYSGMMTGTGSLIKSGGALFTLMTPGIINLTGGSITVQSGQMNINGFATASNFTVASGAILGGTGTITVTNPMNVLGTISPGASIGTLTIMNDVTFGGSDSSLIIEVSPTASDQLDVAGTADVSAATLTVILFPGTYVDGTVYDIVVAENVVGQFHTVNEGVFPTRQFVVKYVPPHLIELVVEVLPFSDFVTSGNAGAAAAAFDALNLNNPDALFMEDFLGSASVAQLQCDFDQMQPALFNAIPITQETATTALRSLFTDRLREIHGTCCERDLLLAKGDGLWLVPIGNFSKQMNRSQNGVCNNTKIGFHSETYGATLGIDGVVSQNDLHNAILGGALSYTHTNLHWEQSQAKSETDSGYGTLYGTIFNEYFYLDATVMGAFVSFDAKRHIFLENLFTKIQRTAKHANNAGELDAHAETGITFNTKYMQYRPYVAVDYLFLAEAGYRERGANSLNLVVRNRYSDLLREEAGFSFSSWQDQETYAWSEEIKLSYVHEERFKGKHTKVRFAGSSSRFEVNGFLPDRDLFAPSFSLNVYWPSIDFSVTAAYSGEFGNHWWAQTGSLKFLWRF